MRKPLRLLAVLMLLLMLLESNFITRDWLDIAQFFKKHMTPLIIGAPKIASEASNFGPEILKFFISILMAFFVYSDLHSVRYHSMVAVQKVDRFSGFFTINLCSNLVDRDIGMAPRHHHASF